MASICCGRKPSASIRGRYFIHPPGTRCADGEGMWGAVNEIVPADKLTPAPARSRKGSPKPPSLTQREYTRIGNDPWKLRRIIDEGRTEHFGLALEGISAADVARGKMSETPKFGGAYER